MVLLAAGLFDSKLWSEPPEFASTLLHSQPTAQLGRKLPRDQNSKYGEKVDYDSPYMYADALRGRYDTYLHLSLLQLDTLEKGTKSLVAIEVATKKEDGTSIIRGTALHLSGVMNCRKCAAPLFKAGICTHRELSLDHHSK